MEVMPRRLRLEYPGALYHLMARGNGRQDIVCGDMDRDRLREHLGRAATRCSWRVYAFAIMSNHLHVVLKTPEPNLARGMQAFLSGYANSWSRRHRFSGHVFQGRYRTELVEDETYLLGRLRGVGLGFWFSMVAASRRLVLVFDPADFREDFGVGRRKSLSPSRRVTKRIVESACSGRTGEGRGKADRSECHSVPLSSPLRASSGTGELLLPPE